MTKVKVGNVSELKPGKMIGAEVNGAKYLVANVNGEFFSIDGLCTHQKGELWNGMLTGSVVKCPKHGSQFDVKTGKNLKGPWVPFGKAYDVKAYRVILEGNDIYLDFP